MILFLTKFNVVIMLKEVIFFMNLKNMKSINCFIPTKKRCFPKCFRVLTGKPSYEDFIIGFIRERTVMTEARVETCCQKVGIDIGYFNGKEILSRSCKERSESLYLQKSHFCAICKKQRCVFTETTEETKKNFELQVACSNYDIVNPYERYVCFPIYIKYRKSTEYCNISQFRNFLKEMGQYHIKLAFILFQKQRENTIEIRQMNNLKNFRVIQLS